MTTLRYLREALSWSRRGWFQDGGGVSVVPDAASGVTAGYGSPRRDTPIRTSPIHSSVTKSDLPPLYRTIVADPPWTPVIGAGKADYSRDKARPQKHYPTMTLEAIRALDVPADASAHLWLWCLSQHVDWGYEVARAWGFEPAIRSGRP